MEVEGIVQGTAEWLEWRKSGITATEASVIAGRNPYKSPLALYYEKLGNGEVSSNAAMEWGSRLESAIVKKFADEHGCEIIASKLYRHDRIPWALASLDAETFIDGERVIVECKTGNDSGKWGDDKVPEYYYDQVQWQMFVTGIGRAYFTVLINGREWFERVVERDETRQRELFEACSVFRQHLDNKVPPSPSESHASDDIGILIANREDEGDSVSIDASSIRDYISAKERLDEEERKLEILKLGLVERLGNHSRIVDGDGRTFVSIVTRKPTLELDASKLKKDYPEIYEKCLKTRPGLSYVKVNSKIFG